MKKIPKSSLPYGKERRLVSASLVAALIGIGNLSGYAVESYGPGNSEAIQQTSRSKSVKGTVIDENGDPMVGVSVVVKGTKEGIATDIDGNFALNVSPGAVLQISYIGYRTQNVKVGSNTSLEIKLLPDDNMLDDVVVVGYGTVKKRDLTGAVSSVKSDMIKMTPTSNPMEALQGRVSGLDIVRETGQAGEGVKMQLRGNRSITAGGDPLFIIDGMPGD